MATVPLVFQQAPVAQPAPLIFGLSDVVVPDFPVSLAGTLPALTVAINLTPATTLQLAAVLPALTVAVRVATIADAILVAVLPGLTVRAWALYDSGTERPTVGQTRGAWDEAAGLQRTSTERESAPTPIGNLTVGSYTGAVPLQATSTERTNGVEPMKQTVASAYTPAIPLQSAALSLFNELDRSNRPSTTGRYGTASPRGSGALTHWQDRYRDRRPTLTSPWGRARVLSTSLTSGIGLAVQQLLQRVSPWDEGIKPAPGMSPLFPPIPPIPTPCYTPPDGDKVYLVFQDPPGDTNLVFKCEKVVPPPTPTVVVPVQRVYMVLNSSSLYRVDDGTQIPCFGMNIALDVNSWTWGFSCAIPFEMRDAAFSRQVDGKPAELGAIINGVEYRVIAESFASNRQFGQMPGLTITGRGKQALLDAPYAPVRNFINTEDINANQLMLQCLQENGVSLGWTVEWDIADWIVPANAFAVTGSYIGAANVIAAAAGAYIQPSPVDMVLRVLSKYPAAPWNWSTSPIDYELPSAVTTVEGIQSSSKLVYNHVYISGTSSGVIGAVTRAGTAGDMEMDMVSDPLIGDVNVVAERGRVLLSDTGNQELVSLALPVLPATGIILPGAMIRYVDTDVTRIGIVRSMSTDVAQSNEAEVWQTIGVETHDN